MTTRSPYVLSKYALLCYLAVQDQTNERFAIGQCRTKQWSSLFTARMAVPTRSPYVLSKYALLCYLAVQDQTNERFAIGQCRTKQLSSLFRSDGLPTRSSYMFCLSMLCFLSGSKGPKQITSLLLPIGQCRTKQMSSLLLGIAGPEKLPLCY